MQILRHRKGEIWDEITLALRILFNVNFENQGHDCDLYLCLHLTSFRPSKAANAREDRTVTMSPRIPSTFKLLHTLSRGEIINSLSIHQWRTRHYNSCTVTWSIPMQVLKPKTQIYMMIDCVYQVAYLGHASVPGCHLPLLLWNRHFQIPVNLDWKKPTPRLHNALSQCLLTGCKHVPAHCDRVKYQI